MIVLVGRGVNWARWLMLASVALGWLVLLFDPAYSLDQGVVAFTVDVAASIVEVYAMYLLFSGEAKRWFKAQ